MAKEATARNPIEPSKKLCNAMCPNSGQEVQKMKQYPYREIVGSILYLSTCTRPDIAYATGVVSRYMQNPGWEHWETAKRILKYLKYTESVKLTFDGKIPLTSVECYADASYAEDLDKRKSTTGYTIQMCGASVSWKSKLQPTVAKSTVEAEYMALSDAAAELIWVKRILVELEIFPKEQPITIRHDNQGSIALAYNPYASHSRVKHIDVHHHFIREAIEKEEIEVEWIPTTDMKADALTKPFGGVKLMQSRSWLMGSGETTESEPELESAPRKRKSDSRGEARDMKKSKKHHPARD